MRTWDFEEPVTRPSGMVPDQVENPMLLYRGSTAFLRLRHSDLIHYVAHEGGFWVTCGWISHPRLTGTDWAGPKSDELPFEWGVRLSRDQKWMLRVISVTDKSGKMVIHPVVTDWYANVLSIHEVMHDILPFYRMLRVPFEGTSKHPEPLHWPGLAHWLLSIHGIA